MNNSTVKKKIIDAFMELLTQQTFSSIKVTNIINLAQISHMSFYRNYPDKYALLEDICFNDFSLFSKIYGSNASWRNVVLCILNCIKNNQKFYNRALAEDCSIKMVVNATVRISKAYTGTASSRYTQAIWSVVLADWRRNQFVDSIDSVYSTLISNLPISDILSGRDLERVLNKYECTNLEDF